MIKFIFIILLIGNFIIYRYSGATGVITFTFGFAVAWLSVFCLALFGGDSIDWRKLVNEK